ncbi:MAG: hypothetical protein HYY46_10395 [Deltaproteobacteria bacterium]|nr:hypothetical protein [Deltaproteobacteria bacterium]
MTISQRTAIRRVIYACVGITSIFVSQAGAGARESNAAALLLVAGYLSKLASGAGTQVTPVVREGEPGGIAGEIFGIPVDMGKYFFAKRVAYMFPSPWGAADLRPADREQVIWENLILHYKGFRRGITVTEGELNAAVDKFLKDQRQPFSRRGDPGAYRRWVSETLREDVDLFENQIRYIIQIRKLKDQLLQEQRVTVTEQEMRQEFLNEKHHVGGELVVFNTKAAAEALYKDVKDPKRWEGMKARGPYEVRPVSLMSLTAIIDLWGVPKEQIYAFHALSLGSIGQDSYLRKVEIKKKYQALKQRVEQLKKAARLKMFVKPE